MKIVSSHLVVLACIILGASAQFDVSVSSVADQTITFNTGVGAGAESNVKVKVTDVCRVESPKRVEVGELYPENTVSGIVADASGISGPGTGNKISFQFVQGIDENSNIYTANADNTASISFCVELGLYASDMLVNFKEVKVSYDVNLATKVSTLVSHNP